MDSSLDWYGFILVEFQYAHQSPSENVIFDRAKTTSIHVNDAPINILFGSLSLGPYFLCSAFTVAKLPASGYYAMKVSKFEHELAGLLYYHWWLVIGELCSISLNQINSCCVDSSHFPAVRCLKRFSFWVDPKPKSLGWYMTNSVTYITRF